MKVLDSIKYMVGIDFLQRRLQKEKQLKRGSKGTKDILPTECGLDTMAKIFGLRARTMVEYPLVVSTRVTGIDYVYQRLRKS